MSEEHKCEWLDQLHQGAGAMGIIAYRLANLADAFAVTGNEIVSEKLNRLCQDISNAEMLIDKGTGGAVQAVIVGADQASTNMFKACLAGVQVGRGQA